MTECKGNIRNSCPLGGALSTIISIAGVIPIVHAGPGCCLQLFMGQQYGCGFQNSIYLGGTTIPCSNTYEHEIIFGGEKRLQEVIKTTLDVMNGELFVVLTGCTASIIGDDINFIVKQFREKGNNIISADTTGFKGNIYTGYELVWEALIKNVIKPLPKEKTTVNIFGVIPTQDLLWLGNLLEVERLLKLLGLKVNSFFTNRQNISAIHESSAASMNIIFSPYVGENIADLYSEKFGIPSFSFSGIPVGPTATSQFLTDIGNMMHIEKNIVDALLKKENESFYDFMNRAYLVYSGLTFQKRFSVIGDSASVIPVFKFLTNDFGQIPLAVILTDNPPQDHRDKIIQEIRNVNYSDTIDVHFIEDMDSIHTFLKPLNSDYILGSSLDKDYASETGAYHLGISFPVTDQLILNKSYAGFCGAVNLIEDYLSPALKNF